MQIQMLKQNKVPTPHFCVLDAGCGLHGVIGALRCLYSAGAPKSRLGPSALRVHGIDVHEAITELQLDAANAGSSASVSARASATCPSASMIPFAAFVDDLHLRPGDPSPLAQAPRRRSSVPRHRL